MKICTTEHNLRDKKPYVACICLLLLMLPWNIILTKLHVPNRMVEIVIVYSIFNIGILYSRLFFLFSFFIVMQRVLDLVAFFVIGKNVAGIVSVAVDSAFLFPTHQITAYIKDNFSLISISIVGLVVVVWVYYFLLRTLLKAMLPIWKKSTVKKALLVESILAILLVLVFNNKAKNDIFFFEDFGEQNWITPVMVPKQPPISKNEGSAYTIDMYYVRGESATDAHMSLYGYARKTTPYLDSIKKNIRMYYNAVSPEKSSASADSQMFSSGYRLPDNDFFVRRHLLEELHSQKIPVVYIGYDDDFGGYQNYVYDSLRKASVKFHATYSDDDLLLVKALESHVLDRPAFYFFHTGGSHVPYKIRTNDRYRIFSKVGVSDKKQQTINEYDDSIVYTDEMVRRLHKFAIKRKKQTGRDFVIWYVSDHSQTLFRDGSNWANYALDKTSVLGRDVPFFIINDKALPCVNRLPKVNTPNSPHLNMAQTFYWVLGSLCLYNGEQLQFNPPSVMK